MPQSFQITERLIGFSANAVKEGERASVITREGLTSLDGVALDQRLDGLHQCLFARVPHLPRPSQIDHLVVVIDPDLNATAYVNELQPVAKARVARAVEAGEPLYATDITELVSYDYGIPIPRESAVIVVQAHGWRRALFYDFAPLSSVEGPREYDLSAVLGQQMYSLMTGQFGARPSPSALEQALSDLEALLAGRCEEEAMYQECLAHYPWLLGGQHTLIERHTALDDRNIPDFTGVRARDGTRDVFEIKQPFLRCFRRDGRFSQDFNLAWEQAERYLTFARQHREYLAHEKNLVFSNPHCFLLIGSDLSEVEIKRLHEREAHNPSISIVTYEQVLSQGRALLTLVERASRIAPVSPVG